MPDKISRAARLSILASGAGLLALTAGAQSDDTFIANGRYSSDYEVGSWPASDRARTGGDYLQQAYRASDELLGGPIAQPGEPIIAAKPGAGQGVIREELRQASHGGGGHLDDRVDARRPLAGMRVVTRSGLELGSVAVVQSDASGKIEAVWVRTRSDGTPDLVQIERDRLEVSDGRIRVMG